MVRSMKPDMILLFVNRYACYPSSTLPLLTVPLLPSLLSFMPQEGWSLRTANGRQEIGKQKKEVALFAASTPSLPLDCRPSTATAISKQFPFHNSSTQQALVIIIPPYSFGLWVVRTLALFWVCRFLKGACGFPWHLNMNRTIRIPSNHASVSCKDPDQYIECISYGTSLVVHC